MDRIERQPKLAFLSRRISTQTLTAKAADGLVTFSVMWALALIFSVVSHLEDLRLANGLRIGLIEYSVLALAAAVLIWPRHLQLLLLLSAAMATQYLFRMPVASNNQTIAFFMNLAIVAVVGVTWLRQLPAESAREDAYEKLRIVARYLLATMYFYGIFHKINVDFLDTDASCAVALYRPLAQPFGLADNLYGRYLAIASTFIIEAITLVCLFWKRYFAFGLIIGLIFHYIIPISGYSWYMDFSSLVFALYTLSVPREASIAFYQRGVQLLRLLPGRSAGATAFAALLAVCVLSGLLSLGVAMIWGASEITPMKAWHSIWIFVWAVVGGIAMVTMTYAALESLPYKAGAQVRRAKWVYIFPAVLFLSCISPYVGLKTESSIAMFSNLHTEGGTTNHLLFAKPVYLFPYQKDVAIMEDSSSPWIRSQIQRGIGFVRFELERFMRYNPRDWVTFTMNGQRYERVSAANYPMPSYNALERWLLIFKPVDYARPKTCTH